MADWRIAPVRAIVMPHVVMKHSVSSTGFPGRHFILTTTTMITIIIMTMVTIMGITIILIPTLIIH